VVAKLGIVSGAEGSESYFLRARKFVLSGRNKNDHWSDIYSLVEKAWYMYILQ
jgi:hypothetical protein